MNLKPSLENPIKFPILNTIEYFILDLLTIFYKNIVLSQSQKIFTLFLLQEKQPLRKVFCHLL